MFAHENEVIVPLIRLAGKAVMEVYQKDLEVIEKADGAGPVTEADLKANQIILKGLVEHFPADGLLSEETPDDDKRLSCDRVWCIDPIDGTKDFLAKNGEFAIQIGLIQDRKAAMGWVYLPARDILYVGGPGLGTHVLQNNETRECTVTTDKPISEWIIVNSRFHRSATISTFMEQMAITKDITHGSVGGKAGMIATGRADLFLYAAPHVSEWDICAPEAILCGAGGFVTDCDGQPLIYNKKTPCYPRGIMGCSHPPTPQAIKTAASLLPPTYPHED